MKVYQNRMIIIISCSEKPEEMTKGRTKPEKISSLNGRRVAELKE